MTLEYENLLSFVQSLFPSMRLTRQRNLALVALGILKVRDKHLTMSEIARAIPTRSNHWHKFKRVRRFLANPHWSPEGCLLPILNFVCRRFRMGHYLAIIIDQSTIAGRWEVLWASIPFRGRALPIFFKLFRYQQIRDDPESSMNRLEEQFITTLVEQLPEQPPPLFLLDRGYARVSLLHLLDLLGTKYVIRARKSTWIRHARTYEGLLASLRVRRGTLLYWPRIRYQRHTQYRGNLGVTLNASAQEPWYLLTNLKRGSSTVAWYERRFRCEELFRDLKDQLSLETIRTPIYCRVERLLLALLVLYLALILIGCASQKLRLRPKACKDRVSPAWLALRLLKMPQFLTPAIINRALFSYSWSLSYESG